VKPALIVLDIQNAWLERGPGMKKGIENRAKTINESIAWFRRRKLPVIVIYHEDRANGVVPGTKAFEFFPLIDIEDTDIKIVKRYPDAFGKTGLQDVLKQEGCDTIVITGVSAGWCVLGTYFGALNWDVASYILKGGVAADREDHVRFAEEICDTTDLQKLEQALQ
jgi:nicotinamidase-related amidase